MSREFESYPWVQAYRYYFLEKFEERHSQGCRIETISMAGGQNPTISVAWLTDRHAAPPQRLSGLTTSVDAMLDDARQQEHAGYAPALIAGDGTEGERFLVVYEPAPSYMPETTLLWSFSDWLSFQTRAHAATERNYLRSAAVLRSEDPRSTPRFVGTLWPFEGTPFAWGATYWHESALADGFIEISARARAMAVAARPWWVISCAEFLPAPPQGGITGAPIRTHRALAIWRDQFMTPWPADAFDQGAHREKEIVVDFAAAEDLAEVLDARSKAGFTLISHAISGKPIRTVLNWSRAGSEVLSRQFIMRGDGNIENAVKGDPGDRVPGAWRARGIGGDDGDSPGLGGAGRPRRSGPFGLHPLDRVMRRLMLDHGVRAAQLCVVRRGVLVYERAYTNAEEGYRITTPHDRIRVGSVAKAMTGMCLVRHYDRLRQQSPGDAGLDRRFGSELGIERAIPDAAFDAITLRSALRHVTGMNQDQMSRESIFALVYPEKVQENDEDGEPKVQPQPQPGDMTEAFAKWPDPLVVLAPETNDYNNYVYVALGELFSSIENDGAKHLYERSIRYSDLLPPTVFEPVLGGQGYESCKARGEVLYHPRLLSISRSSFPEGGWTIDGYNFGTQFSGGSGGWALSMREMAAVMAGLTPKGGRDTFLTLEEKWLLAYGFSDDEVPGGLGWNRSNVNFTFSAGGRPRERELVRIDKNGLTGDATALAVHYMPRRGSNQSPDELDTLDVLVAFNTEVPHLVILAPLQAALIETEGLDAWAPRDLFENSGLD